MAKFILVGGGMISFKCPGCRGPQQIPVEGPNAWDWNKSLTSPTLKPSILAKRISINGEGICHSYVTDGKIQFLNDCTHSLAGKTVELPEINCEADLFYSLKPESNDA